LICKDNGNPDIAEIYQDFSTRYAAGSGFKDE
jgi:hypothetical protein